MATERVTPKLLDEALREAVSRGGLRGPVALEHRSSVYGRYAWRLVEMPNGPHSYISTGRFGETYRTAREMLAILRTLGR